MSLAEDLFDLRILFQTAQQDQSIVDGISNSVRLKLDRVRIQLESLVEKESKKKSEEELSAERLHDGFHGLGCLWARSSSVMLLKSNVLYTSKTGQHDHHRWVLHLQPQIP